MKKIDLRLFPDVICRGKVYSIYDENTKEMKKSLEIPLIKAYSQLENNGRILLTANASYGKSSSLTVFEGILCLNNIPCASYECRNLNRELMQNIEQRAKRSTDTVYIFDAIDELDSEMKDSFGEMMKELNKTDVKIIVSSRFDPMEKNAAESGYEFLMGYEKITICPFSDEQLDSLISRNIDRNSGYYKLLNTTMFLSLHLELERKKRIDGVKYTVKKEAEFIKQYFSLLSPENEAETVSMGDLVHLGEYVHKQRNSKLIRYKERIPWALRHIFYYSKKNKEGSEKCELYNLDAIQQKYLNYVHGVYLFNRIIEIFEEMDEEDILKDLSRLIDIPLSFEVSEAFYYCGQLISLLNKHESEEIKEYLKKTDIGKPNKRKNLLFIFFGANNDLDEEVKRRLSVNYNIDFNLFSDVVYKDRVYSIYDTEKKQIEETYRIPLVKAYSELDGKQRLLVIAKASIGKSTSLRILEEEKLADGELCSFYECRKLDNEIMDKICRQVEENPQRLIIFDAFDELSEESKDKFCKMMTVLDKSEARFIVSSRYDPIEKGSAFGMEFFDRYEKMFIRPFSDVQIKMLVGNSVSKRSGYYKMLHNSMFMSMYREISETKLAVKNEAEFIKEYFFMLYSGYELEDSRKNDLLSLGEYLHKQRRDNNTRTIIAIPRPLRNIFFYYIGNASENNKGEQYILDSTHQKYLNYLHGEYILEQLLEISRSAGGDSACAEALANIIDMSSTYEVSEALYYAGQLAGVLDAKQRNAVIRVLGLRNDGILKRYENLLSIFLGVNKGVADDIEGVFKFYSPVMRERRYDFIHACDRIRVLKAPSIEDVDFRIGGFTALEEINLENAVFRSEGNCLIQKYVGGLSLGCDKSIIPDGVRFISKHAFSYCDELKKIVIPPSVETIDSLAFNRCSALEYVEIGEGVSKLSKEAFHNCKSIKHLSFKNPQMSFSAGRYESGAFGELENIESATVPTQGIYYLMNVCSGNIGKLSVYQGRNFYRKESLTFQDIERTNRIKNLYIYKDVENISVEAFHKFRNELESIVVEEGNAVYGSEGNCLMNKKDGKNNSVILGCKNSIIPQKDVKRLKSYSFVNCNGLEDFVIPDNITQIGEKAFNQCTKLKSIHFGTGIELIENAAFRGCISLKKVTVGNVNKWAKIKFGEDINSSPVYYSKNLYGDGIKDGKLVLDGEISSIAENVFKRCGNIESVYIPKSVKEIGKGAFSGCFNIKEVRTDDLTSWCERVYNSASSNPTLNGAELYIGKRKAVDVVIDSPISKVTSFSFAGCSSLESITFKSGQVVVEKKAFAKCPNLKTVIFEEIPKYLDKNAFMDCSVKLIVMGEYSEQLVGISGVKEIIYS